MTGAVQTPFETSNAGEKAGDLMLGGGRRLAMFRSQFTDFNGSPRPGCPAAQLFCGSQANHALVRILPQLDTPALRTPCAERTRNCPDP